MRNVEKLTTEVVCHVKRMEEERVLKNVLHVDTTRRKRKK
jgi:hypothetical protein